MIGEAQLPKRFRDVITEQEEVFDKPKDIVQVSKIPQTDDIPIEDPAKWLKIPSVICVFVDMKNSTGLSAQITPHQVAGAYSLFTGTAVRLFDEFKAPYIDVRGDGAFALFDEDQPYRALCAAVTFKTFADAIFKPRVKEKWDVEVGSHIGIDQRPVLVRKIGLKRHGLRTDRQNEVWAGKPVNMASKLASRSDHNQLYVSDRFFKRLKDERATKSCGCPDGGRVDLWTPVDLSEDKIFDFDKAYKLGSNWCGTHGADFCDGLLAADEA